jgi:HCOMODA/2-hydroxy-3-carboxy-muconic semialdehyde decarboxylase
VDRAAAISELVIANRVVAHLKLVDSFGHVTIRNPENPLRFLMSRARAPRLVTPEDILEFDLDSTPIDPAPTGKRPYSERFIHGCIYKTRPDVMSICHNHAHELLPLAVTKTVMRPALHTAAVIGREVPVWDIRDQFGDTNMLVTSNEMGASLAALLGMGKAALMRGHGSVVVGATVQDAVFSAFYLRLNAEVMIKAMSTGETITYLSPGEVDLSGALHSQPAAQGRAWEDWCAQAGAANL